MYMYLGYHSLPNAGTEYTPQWIKIPNLEVVNHDGTLYFFNELQVALKGPLDGTGSDFKIL